jgi:hypothetical protein
MPVSSTSIAATNSAPRFSIDFHAQRREQRGEQHDEQREAVDGDVIVDAELGDPRHVGLELVARLSDLEVGVERDRGQELEHGHAEADALGEVALLLRQRGDDDRPRDRQHEEDCEELAHG